MKKTIVALMVAALFTAGCSSRSADDGDFEDFDSGLDTGAAIDSEFTFDQLAEPANIRIFSNPPSLLTGSTETATVSAVVTDDQNRAIPGHQVSFSSDAGVLQNIVAETNEAGEATAQLNLAGDVLNNTITVTASVGDVTSDTLVAAQGTAITMDAPEDILVGDLASLEFTLLTGAGTPIPNEAIEFSSQAGNILSPSTAVTNALGTVNVTLTTDEGADVIGATALGGTVFTDFSLPFAENEQANTTPVRLRIISSESVIETGGNDVARITTLVTDENNRVLADQEVSFSSTGGILRNIEGRTNEAGQASAELSVEGDFRNQDIIVTAVVDGQADEVLVTTEGSKVSVAGPTSLVSGDVAELEVTLIAGNEQPIANQTVSIRSEAGNTIEPENAVTDSDGKVTVSVASDLGTDTITVEALESTVSIDHRLQVAADVLTVTPGDYDSLPVSEYSEFSVRWTRNGTPVSSRFLRFSTTVGLLRAVGSSVEGSSSLEAFTSSDGVARVELSANSAGPATVSFADSTDADPASQFEVEFVAIEPAVVSLNATPASVSTGNSSTVTAAVVDAFGNPVKDTVVEFSSADLRGGSLSPVSAITDADGNASITFNAGPLPTEINGISITAETTDHRAVAPATVALTVTERQLNVVIGMSGSISEIDSDTRYSRTGVVQVTDGAGRPVPDAVIQMGLTPTAYRFGHLFQDDTDGDGNVDSWNLNTTTFCVAEDLNGNRILDSAEGEDLNNNGVLDTFMEIDFNDNGVLDRHEDLNGNGVLDDGEDFNNNGVLDIHLGEDLNDNGVLDAGEDLNGNGVLDRDDDLNNNGVLDVAEDLNGNGIIDGVDSNGNGIIDRSEDSNENGILDPRDPALIDADPDNTPTVVGGQITTDESGVGFFRVVYPQSNAWYFRVEVTARVEALGVEGVADSDVRLWMSADDITNIDASPANLVSPFGVGPAAPWRGCIVP